MAKVAFFKFAFSTINHQFWFFFNYPKNINPFIFISEIILYHFSYWKSCFQASSCNLCILKLVSLTVNFFQFLDKSLQVLFSHFTKNRWIAIFKSAFPKQLVGSHSLIPHFIIFLATHSHSLISHFSPCNLFFP